MSSHLGLALVHQGSHCEGLRSFHLTSKIENLEIISMLNENFLSPRNETIVDPKPVHRHDSL